MGLFISLDGGMNWLRSKYQNMPWYNLVRDLKIHPKTHDLIVASHGRGIYIIDDLQPLREMIQSDLNNDFILYPIQSFKYNYGAQYPQPAETIAGWVGENKTVSPTIYYYLKQRSNDAVKIEVYDAANKKIKDINGTGLKGLNKVNWGLTINPPKVAQGGFIAGSSVLYSGFIAPRVPVGKYKIVVNAEGKKSEQFLQIEANPQKGLTTSSIALLYQQAMRLYNLQEKLFVLVDSLDKTIAAINKSDTTALKTKDQLKKLDSFKREIIELNRKTIFFDEFKYRRRLSDLYLAVAMAIEPLSAKQEKGLLLMEEEFEAFKKQFYSLIATR
jgi:hypothetical protein